ncbi:M48 family metalloprotease [Deferrisoma palaeochoriense]
MRRSSMRFGGALGFGAALMLLLAGCAVNPVTGRQEFVLLAEEQELRMGEEAYPVYTQISEGEFPDPGLQAYVAEVGRRLAALSHRPGLPYEFNVVNASEINAYALPGGKISITRGLLTRMENEAQLAAVLGHEIGHVAARHQAAGYTRQVLAGVLTTVGLVALETARVQGGELLAQGGLLATNLVLMKYSRDQERQADELGMEYMTAAGYNPEGMVQVMEILKASHDREPSAVEALFLSHPLTSERLARAREMAGLQPARLKTPERLRAEPFRKATAGLRKVAPAYAKMDEGRKALAKGKVDAALRLLREATELAPGHALIWAFRAAAEAKAEKLDEALRSAERAATLAPKLFRARFTAGVLAFEAGRHGRSLEHLAVAEKLVPGQPTVAFFRGRNYEAQGNREAAAKEYAAVLQKVRKGPMAEYCFRRLSEWGYIRTRG